MPDMSFADRLSHPRPVLLDGPTGTELARRGVATDVPLWSAEALWSAPDVVRQIHQDYVEVGAELITANTFRTQPWTLRKLGRAREAGDLTRLAVQLAREAGGGRVWIAGSLAPLEDCYRPDLTPSAVDLEREHRVMAELLAEAGVDVILAETHPTIRESMAALAGGKSVGLPVIVSWVCGRDGRLLSGETLGDAAAAVLDRAPLAVCVNCLPAEAAERAVRELVAAAGKVPVGVYANVGWAEPDGRWVEGSSVDSAVYADFSRGWLRHGVRLIGGCCGTTPEHIERVARLVESQSGG